MEIDQLEANQSYRIHLKVRSDAGDNEKLLYFRTAATYEAFISNDESIFLLIIVVSSFVLTMIFCFLSVLLITFLQKLWKQTDRPQRFKPVLYSAKIPHENQHALMMNNYAEHVRSNSFASEDSQGNINPYAVTDFTAPQNEPAGRAERLVLCNPNSSRTSNDSGIHFSLSHPDGFACPLHSSTGQREENEPSDSYQSSFV